MPDQNRQLAAIMFTDIVGYTLLMGKDERMAMELVRRNKEIQKPLVEKYRGTWLKEMGDGAMSSFQTASDAISCSLEIQKQLLNDKQLVLRIGIHLGEIIVQDGDIYGDGVNIASRLQSIADPGGIYISDAVQNAIRSLTDIQVAYLGELQLKNVDYAIKTYALRGEGLPQPKNTSEKHLAGRFFAELQRRGILRVGFTYLVISLLIVMLLPYAELFVTLPEWLDTLLIVILTSMFPFAIYLAWKYERSPAGFVRTSSAQSWKNPFNATERKPLTSNFIISILFLVIMVMYAYPRFFTYEDPKETSNSLITEKSLAVLPFDNMSNDPNQEYFSDGMMEAILNHLSKIEGIHLTSRTTMMQYKGAKKSIGEIANEVGVRYVLAGSVQKSETMFRINAQLIDALDDQHIWSESYDRNLSDALKLQSEVAKEIAAGLNVNIQSTVMDRIETLPTQNSKAYDLYLQANQYPIGHIQRKTLFEEAISIDSGFAPAYAQLGNYWLSRGAFAGDLSANEVLKRAEPLLNHAIELDINLAAAHENLSLMYLWYKWDFNAALRERLISHRLEPGNLENRNIDLLLIMGKYEQALSDVEKMSLLDPNNMQTVRSNSLALVFLNKLTGSEPFLKTAFENENRDVRTYGDGGRIYFYLGFYDKVIEFLEEGLDEGYRFPRLTGTLAMAYYHKGRIGDMDEIIEELKNHSQQSPVGSPSFYLAMIYSQMGKSDMAFEWIEKAYKDREVEMQWLKVEPPFEPLHNDPRWQEMLDKVGFPD